MPNLLADGTYRNGENQDYSYEQKLYLQNISFTHFADSDYNDREPTLGFKLARNTAVLNYTLNFKKDPLSTVTSGSLVDFIATEINILGKDYTIVSATNASASKLTLLGGSDTDLISLNEEVTKTVGGEEYTVKLSFVDDDEAVFEVNGAQTTKLNAGDVFPLGDGSNIGVKSINYQPFAGGIMSVE